jgi:putative transposase
MPRVARRDAPGCVHHVTARGIEKRAIFYDDRDCCRFLDLLEEVLQDTAVVCFAWALMPNHFHLVLRTTEQPLRRVMARLNTAYAVGFNLRHGRVGHLFQNRYHSKIIGDDDYLRVAIRYVHLNPLRAGIVHRLSDLEVHPWTGHAALMGAKAARFLAVDSVLAAFADEPHEARRRLSEWMLEPEPHRAQTAMRPPIRELVSRVCRRFAVSEEDLLGRSREQRVSLARSVVAHLACDSAGYSQAEVARTLGVAESSVHRARRRGRTLVASFRAAKQGEGTSPKAR